MLFDFLPFTVILVRLKNRGVVNSIVFFVLCLILFDTAFVCLDVVRILVLKDSLSVFTKEKVDFT